MDQHTESALKVGGIILNGHRTVPTGFGKKTRAGIADLIERETGLLEWIKTAQDCHESAEAALAALEHDDAEGAEACLVDIVRCTATLLEMFNVPTI